MFIIGLHYEQIFTIMHIGSEIHKVFSKSGIRVTTFAKSINTVRVNVYQIFKRPDINTALLQKIGKVLNHNFFEYYCSPLEKPEYLELVIKLDTLLKENELQKKYIEVLENNNKSSSKSKKP